VYVREVASYESLMALIHELAHGIDFSGRRHEPNGFEIPETPHVEAFSQRAELTFCKRLDPSGVLHDARLELICAKQIFWYVLKKRWLLNFPETLVEARAQWRTYLLEVFGRNFNLRPQLDLLWLTHRGLKQSLRETQNYLML
jgi:hypothetical protein